MLPVITLYVYLASVGTHLVAGDGDPEQIAASILGFITAGMAILYTTKIVHGSLYAENLEEEKAIAKSPEKKKARR